jgi:hypothetical protein
MYVYIYINQYVYIYTYQYPYLLGDNFSSLGSSSGFDVEGKGHGDTDSIRGRVLDDNVVF